MSLRSIERIFALCLAGVLGPSAPMTAHAQQRSEYARQGIPVARAAAKSWLSLVDSGKYAESWDKTVVPMVDKDGQWRVSGYFVKKN